MSSISRLQSAQQSLANLYAQHAHTCTDLQRVLLPAHPLDTCYLSDQPNIFRFLKSAHFDSDAALQRVRKTLAWRAEQDFALDSLPVELLSIISVQLDMRDVCLRPTCVLRLRQLHKGTEGLRRSLVCMFDVARRALALESGGKQMALVVDLQGAGYANLVSMLSVMARAALMGLIGHRPSEVAHAGPRTPLPRALWHWCVSRYVTTSSPLNSCA